ncbi:hypothetical protein KUCAC02_022718 [Chaenocephalus aceratus]|uniref:Uncharacterized protein n=1 Tax=Chaenocephalus aceratus TaxID=36190 RepID=A0ACB9XPW1_CHAAC|nr:hypothetical protein KUCAC02_022718 [Chaenocephalus aceratus]
MARLSFSEVGLLLLLVLALVLSAESGPRRQKTLRRKKREWILPPAKLMENTDYRHKKFIAKIRSDKDLGELVDYYLTGEGADKEPFNIFVVDRKTGFVRITELLDREKRQFYNLTGIARFKDGKKAEDDVPLTFTVLDQNDNTPYFELQMGNITEESKPGSVVMQIKGNDNDEAGTINSEISYRIVSQEPAGTGHMFTLDRKTGQLYVKEENLDRETIDFYKLVVEGTDMGGGSSGLVGTGTVEVKVLDINDNIPTLEKSEYDGEVEENVVDVVVMRIKALDKDLRHSDNWQTVFKITKGNEDNIFSIETDKETNEGVLKLIKAVDYEDVQNLELGLIVTNVAPFVKGGPIIMDVDVQIGEEDPNEAPKDGVITVFAAVDPDTGLPAEDVKYAKAFDPENWFTIDEKTAEIKLNKVPDRESPFVVNGTYIAKILAITDDMPSKTVTGTIAIQILDSNDHCPTLTTTHSTQCSDETTVYVTAFDEDANPNGAPFTFRVIPDGTRGSWDVEVVNKTSAALHSRDPLWSGLYEVQVEVLDAQGLSCPSNEIFTVDVCTCVETKDCKIKAAKLETTSTELSAPAISLLLSAMCLLLFIPLLMLFCQCGGELFPDSFRDMPWETKEQLISYHTEGRGEDKEVPLHSISVSLGPQKTFGTAQGSNSKGTIKNTIENNQTTTIHEGFLERFRDTRQSWMEVDNNAHRLTRDFGYGYGSATISRNTLQHTTALYEDIALPDAFLNDYYSQKAMCALPAKDSSLEYHFEGQGSSAGSVGCCSLLETNNDLQFLDDLGPKFKTLSDICSPPKPTPKPSLTHKIVARTVFIQPQPVYYATNPVLQPMHYVVQPQLQNTVMLADWSHGANLPGLYVVSGPQGSPPGLVIQGIEGPQSPASPVSSTFFLPGSPGVSPGSGLAKGWEMIGPDPGGKYMLVKDKRPDDAVKGLEDKSQEVGSEPQFGDVTEDQMDRDLEEDVSPAESVVSDIETNQVTVMERKKRNRPPSYNETVVFLMTKKKRMEEKTHQTQAMRSSRVATGQVSMSSEDKGATVKMFESGDIAFEKGMAEVTFDFAIKEGFDDSATGASAQEKHGGAETRCPLMVKILDAVKGTLVGSVTLRLSQKTADGGWTQIANGITDATGEVHNLITEQQFPAGVYRVEFDTKTYWKNEGSTLFHEVAEVVFEAHAGGHHHYTLALLLSPYSYTTTAVVTDAH